VLVDVELLCSCHPCPLEDVVMDLSLVNGVVLIPLAVLAVILFDWLVVNTPLDEEEDAENEQK
jgi:hypothetical protein